MQGEISFVKMSSVDMHEPFNMFMKMFCLNAQICINRFHLAQKENDAFDKLRKSEFRLADAANDKFLLKMLTPHQRFVLIEQDKKLNKSDLRMLDQLKKINKNILNGKILFEYFQKILDKTDINEFRKSLKLWYQLVRESEIKLFKELALMI